MNRTAVLAAPNASAWIVECTVCGPLGVVDTLAVDQFMLTHFHTH